MKSQTIITADDHPLLLKGLNDFLLEKKHNIIDSAINGKEAYNLIVKLKFKYIYGLYLKNKSRLFVSSGSGCWGPKLRIGSSKQM